MTQRWFVEWSPSTESARVCVKECASLAAAASCACGKPGQVSLYTEEEGNGLPQMRLIMQDGILTSCGVKKGVA